MPHSLDLRGRPVTVVIADNTILRGTGASAPVATQTHSGLRPGMAPTRRRIFTSAAAAETQGDDNGRIILSDDHGKKGGGGGGAGEAFFGLVLGAIAVVLVISGVIAWFDWLSGRRVVSIETTQRVITRENVIIRESPVDTCKPVFDRTENGVSYFKVC